MEGTFIKKIEAILVLVILLVIGVLLYQNFTLKDEIRKYRAEILKAKMEENDKIILTIEDLLSNNKDSIAAIEKHIYKDKKRAKKRIEKIKKNSNIDTAVTLYYAAKSKLNYARANKRIED